MEGGWRADRGQIEGRQIEGRWIRFGQTGTLVVRTTAPRLHVRRIEGIEGIEREH